MIVVITKGELRGSGLLQIGVQSVIPSIRNGAVHLGTQGSGLLHMPLHLALARGAAEAAPVAVDI